MKESMSSIVAASVLTFFATSARPADYADIPISRRLEQAARMAKGIVVDGDGRDWAQVQAQYALSGNVADPARDVVATRVLADELGLRVCVATRGAPAQNSGAVGFRLDLLGMDNDDFGFAYTEPTGCRYVNRLYKDPAKPRERKEIRGVQSAIKQCAEWFVPWGALEDLLSEDERAQLRNPGRSWVRVTPFTLGANGQIVDFGAAAACYRESDEKDLDAPLPADAPQAAELPFMVEGKCYVTAGAKLGPEGDGLHRTAWCYDFTVVDAQNFPSKPLNSKANSDYYAFGKQIFAPVAGVIVRARDDLPDHAPFGPANREGANFARLKYDGDKLVYFVHNQQNSLVPNQGDRVSVGDPIARIGNTGMSVGPHLHVQVQVGNNPNNLVPLALRDVRVSLNHAANDYWARKLRRWNVQEGFFVEDQSGITTKKR